MHTVYVFVDVFVSDRLTRSCYFRPHIYYIRDTCFLVSPLWARGSLSFFGLDWAAGFLWIGNWWVGWGSGFAGMRLTR